MRTSRTIPTTTLDVARAIADAVLSADGKGRGRDRNSLRDKPTQAVFSTLERAGVWFMRVESDDRPRRALEEQSGICRWCGCTDGTPCVDAIDGACSWVNRAHTLCSSCVGIERLIHTTRGRAELLTAFSSLAGLITARTATAAGLKRRTGGTRRLRQPTARKAGR